MADALAVMDATDAGQAILVGLSFGGLLACVLAAYHPERVKAAILAGTAAVIGPTHKHMSQQHFMARQQPRQFEGWNKYNRAHWLADYPDFAEHFIRSIFTEPHSTKQIEEGIAWAGDTDGPVLVKTVEARTIVPPFDVTESMYRRIRCPVLAIHGDNDQIQPHARGKLVAELTGAELVTIADGGHNPLGRYSRQVQHPDQRLSRPPAGPCGAQGAGAPRAAGEEGALSFLAHRPRARPPRHRHRPRIAPAASRPAGRLAGAGSR